MNVVAFLYTIIFIVHFYVILIFKNDIDEVIFLH